MENQEKRKGNIGGDPGWAESLEGARRESVPESPSNPDFDRDSNPDGETDRGDDFAPGETCWVIPEGYIPSGSRGPGPAMTSHETACILNAGPLPANIRIVVYFADREPAGPYRMVVDPRRTRHVRFNDLTDPEPVPVDTDYASVLFSDVPVIVQHTRLDSRQAENALMTTMAYPVAKPAVSN